MIYLWIDINREVILRDARVFRQISREKTFSRQDAHFLERKFSSTYMFIARSSSIKYQFRSPYDVFTTPELSLCLSYELYETRTVSESCVRECSILPLYEEALTRVSRNVRLAACY